MRVDVRVIDDLADLSDEVRHQWDELPRPSPMQSPEWLVAWWETYGARGRNRLQLVLVHAEETLIGVAPFYVERRPLGSARLRFLGDGAVCSDHATVAARPEHQQLVRSAVEEHLRACEGRSWHSIYWQSIDCNNVAVHRLAADIGRSAAKRQERERSGCWQVSLPASWAEYLACLSKNHRKRCRRWQRDYFDSGRASVEISTPADAAEAWDALAELNMQRRAEAGDRSAFADERFHRFHLRILPAMIRRGEAELRQLYVDGRYVAAEYVLMHQRTMFCYQSGMARGEGRDGYGNLSILALVRDAIDRGMETLDFLRGDEEYKQHWGAERVACVDHSIHAATVPGYAQHALQQSLATARELRGLLARTP